MAKNKKTNFLLYGASGYTGKLIIEEAIQRGLNPILAGRNEEKIKALANIYKLEYRVFSLQQNLLEIAENIEDVKVVLNCAGPFIHTARPMAIACLRAQTHYLDITGEIPVFEAMQGLDEQAKEAQVALIPGVGFDVVPTDCLAAILKNQMKDAVDLSLAFIGLGGISQGTAKSSLNQLPGGGRVRRDGKLKQIPHLSIRRTIELLKRKYQVYSIPWGDVFTAFYSTGIPNITVYTALPPAQVTAIKAMRPMLGLLKNRFVRSFFESQIEKRPEGPDDVARDKGRSFLWGEVVNARGKTLQVQMSGPEGYAMTALTAVSAVERVLEQKKLSGFLTPSLAFGADFSQKAGRVKLLRSVEL